MSDGRGSFGDVLRRLRTAASLSQEELAERSGLSRNGISDLERGARHVPRLETVRLLADGLNLDPSDRALLLSAARPAMFRAAQVTPAYPALVSLPTPLGRLIGRETELAELRAGFQDEDGRLLTLTGPGGVGKTRLALAVAAASVAAAFADGAVFVDLAPVADAALVLSAIAQALDVRETHGRSVADVLHAALRDRHLLLVLDNFEHVLPAAVDLAALLAACPRVTALVTSRAPLRLRGERRFVTPPLTLPGLNGNHTFETVAAAPAIALFVERAQSVQPDFTLDPGNADAVVAICQRLDGLPLAIELAAAWAHVLPPPELLRRLERRLPLLRGGAEDQPVRLRSMGDAIAWSHGLLSDDEARLFRFLAVFVGGFTLEAAEWVSDAGCRVSGDETDSRHPAPATLDLLAGLVDKSLVRRTDGGSGTRFGMLETIREYAQERLAESGEAEIVAARHTTWCLRVAADVRRAGGQSRRSGLDILEAEHPNMRTALDRLLTRGQSPNALRLAADLAVFWMQRGHGAEGRVWLERALMADGAEPSAARADALVGLNLLLWDHDEFEKAHHLLDDAEAAARIAGDAEALAYARLNQGYVAAIRGDHETAMARGEEILAICGVLPQGFSCHGALWLLARTALARGENEQAAVLHERLLASALQGGDEISIANGHHGLAILAERCGEVGRALVGYVEAAAVCRGFGSLVFASHCLDAAAATATALGWPDAAVRLFAAAQALRDSVGAAPVLDLQVDRHRHMQALGAARIAIGEQCFAAAWAAGRDLSFDEAITEATSLARRAENTGARMAKAL
jgi:predicted ATPase/DNA-binding XRE family transcriptional regulator